MANIIMVPTEGFIYADTVRDILAQAGGSGMTDKDGSSLFTKEAVKGVFAKFKPTRWADHFPSPEDNHWKGVDGLCGFGLGGARAYGFDELPSKYSNSDEMNGWEYLPPRGYDTYAEPYRIDDFRGHFPGAPALVNGFYIQPRISNTTNSVISQITLPIANQLSLTWADFDTLKNYYFGVLLYKDSSNYVRVTATATLLQGGAQVEFNATAISEGSYTAYPFICSAKHTQTDGAVSGEVIYALPLVQPIAVEVVSETLNVEFIPSFQYRNGTGTGKVDSVELALTINNKTGSVMTFTNNTATLKYRNGNPEIISGNEKQMTLAPFSAPAGISTVDLADFTGVHSEMRNNCEVVLSLNNAQYEVKRAPAADFTDIPK